MIDIKKTGMCKGCTQIELQLREWHDGYGHRHYSLECDHAAACKLREGSGDESTMYRLPGKRMRGIS